jgi:hypothetical protein
MKNYETAFEEYLKTNEKYNLHPELSPLLLTIPSQLSEFKNMIIYGPPGVGKYTQTLSIIQKYSPTKLKYDKKISVLNEKKISVVKVATQEEETEDKKKKDKKKTVKLKKQDKKDYVFRISDVHYEIDMSTLGCNSKVLWHEIFFQIVDIISVKTDKKGILVCKNFHMIHNELLEIFYSYLRHPLHHYNIQLKFILITEHIAFIPENIINVCEIVSVKRPSKEQYMQIVYLHPHKYPIEKIDIDTISNMKELYSLQYIKQSNEIPKDVFHIVSDAIIQQMLYPNTLKITELRNHLYDILIYNIDVFECIWYILKYFISQNKLQTKEISLAIRQTFIFLKYYNNNYRSIYHLESIVLYIFNKVHYP